MSEPTLKCFKQVAPGFYNCRGSFTLGFGLIDVGTHMSLIRLPTGKFLVVDTIELDADKKQDIDHLTDKGALIDAVIGVHPFHTVYFEGFYKHYPQSTYYGTPRHTRKLTSIPWKGHLNDQRIRSLWEPHGIYMRIPEGGEFVAPTPELTNHFSSVIVFHQPSKTLHVDDTFGYQENDPGFVLRLAGVQHGKLSFHPQTLRQGLYCTKEGPLQFKSWMEQLLKDWDFDNLCTAHNGNKLGGAKSMLQEAFQKLIPSLEKLSEKNSKNCTL